MRLLEELSRTDASQRFQDIKHDVEVLIPKKVRAYVKRNAEMAQSKDVRIVRALKELSYPEILHIEKNSGEVKSGKLCKGLGLAAIVVVVVIAIIAMTTGGKKAEVGYPAPIHTTI